MKTLIFIATLALSLNAVANDHPETVKDLDLVRYQGLWHQISLLPNVFQRQCSRNTQAQYTLQDDGEVEVINSCTLKNGQIKSITGRARINPKYDDNAKLQVTFTKIFAWAWLFSGDYWVLDIDDNYQTVVVGHPDLYSGWVLARTPVLSKIELARVAAVLTRSGYDTCDFEMTMATETNGNESKLCSYLLE